MKPTNIITTPSGRQFDLLLPGKDDVRVEDVLEQLQQITMYVDRDYTALHRASNVLSYLTAVGVDTGHLYNWLGTCMLYSYNVYDTRYPITVGFSPYVTPYGLPLKNRLLIEYGIRHGVNNASVGYMEQLTAWEAATMYPEYYNRELLGTYSRSYCGNLFIKGNEKEIKASLYDKISHFKRRHTH